MADNITGIDLNEYLDELREMGLFIHDVEHSKAFPNSFWTGLGYTEDDMTDLGFLDFVHPDDREMVISAYGKVASAIQESYKIMFRIKNRDGDWRWVLSSTIGIQKSAQGQTLKYIGFDHDVTTEIESRMKAESALREAESLIRATEIITSNLDLRGTVDAVLEQVGNVIPFTSASVQLLEDDVLKIIGDIGLKEDQAAGEIFFRINPDTPNYHVMKERKPFIVNNDLFKKYPQFFDTSVKGIGSWMGIPLICREKLIGMIAFDHFRENWFKESTIKLAQAFSSQVAIALENALLFEEVRNLAVKDELTGCYSRRFFFESLESECRQSERYRTPLSVMMFDADDFKSINDNYGHMTGDRVLKDIAAVAFGCLRTADIFCRYGGEEFVVLMPSTGIDEARIVAERVRNSIEAQVVIPRNGESVTVSIGCSSFKEADYRNPDDMIVRVDRAMYSSKAAGKNRISIIE